MEFQMDFLFAQMVGEAETFGGAVLDATNHSMLADDAVTTANIVRDLAKGEEISYVRIYNHDGVMRYADQPSKIGTNVDKEAEACFACHSVDKPFREVAVKERARIYKSSKGYRILGMITPIYNEKSCSTAPCHVHPPSRKVLGIIDVGMSLKEFDAGVRSTILRVVIMGVTTVVAVTIALVTFILLRVNRPADRLVKWVKAAARGEWTRTVPISSDDELGKLARAVGTMSAQMKRRTDELERSRREYKTFFEQVPCFISVIDRDFKIVRQNSKMRELFRGSVGMHCYEVYKKLPEKCEDCSIEKTFVSGEQYMKQECGLAVTGEETLYVSYTLPIKNERGDVKYAMAMAIDIGDRVRLERELQVSKDFQTNLIENSIHGIIAIDEIGRVNLFNHAAENLLKYTAEDVVGDTDLEKYFPGEFVEMIRAAFEGHRIEEPRLVAQEAVIRSSEGETLPVRFSGVLLFDEEKTVGAVGFYQDLRTFKRLEREKADADRLAVVGQTVAGLAHGIKNVLQGLEGGLFVVETAIEDHDDTLLARGWEMIQNNILRITALVKDLLSYSKERAPEYGRVDPNALAEEVCALFDLRAEEQSIQIVRDFDPNIDPILVDQRGIHTALTNLVSNALDACEIDPEERDHLIVVRTRQDPSDGVVFDVSDNGIGVDEDSQEKIFSVFFSTKGSKGTGLGLLVTSKIVHEHGGDISFDSAPGVGTTFTINLPRPETDRYKPLKIVRDEEPDSDSPKT